ncbi:MAG TPA: FtsX-like permease family protein, partial [Blastocatellia bacterium]|nr:FtsX-like permease family protein [Blastocatellia bacterium]
YSSGEKILGFYQTLVKGISSKPEVESVGAVSDLPLTGDDDRLHFTVEGAPALAPADRPIVQIRSIIGAYFHAMRIPLNAGREFVEEDGPNSPKIAIINQTLADNFFQGQDPLGKHITLQFETEPRQIVGVVGNVRVDDLDVAVRPQAYVPLSQSPSSYMGLVVHGNSSTVDLRPTIRLAVSAIDSQQPIYNVRTLDEILQRSVSQKRFTMLVMAFLAGMAGILAAIGIYGVMSHSVSRRTGEIGIRMALGADPSQVRQMVLGRAVALTAIGVFGGVVGSLALGGVISSMLSHVSSSDPIVMSMVCLGAIAVALLASYLPARKATRVDPMLALRKE